MRALRRWIAPALLLLLLCILFHWRLVLSRQYTWLDSPDIANMEVPRFQFQAREWRAGRFPLWDPTQWCGQPFLGQMTGAAYPPHWLFSLWAGRHARISQSDLHWYLVLVRFFAVLNGWLLCRYLRRSQMASIAGGLLFGLGSFIGNTDWPTVLNGILWAPLVFLFLFRAVDGRRPWFSAALSGSLLGLACLSGHHEAPAYLSLAVGATWIYYAFRARRADARVVQLAGTAVLFTVLASGLQTLPALEYGRLAVRWAGTADPLGWKDTVPYLVHERFAFPLSSLPGIVVSGLRVPVSLHVGVAGSLLILLAAVRKWREPRVRLFCVLAAAALVFALAGRSVLHGVLYSVVPFLEKTRVPARAVAVFGFAAAVLAAYGVDALRRAARASWMPRLAWGLVVLGGVIQFVRAALNPQRWGIHEGILLAGLAALVAGVVLLAGRRRAAGAALITVCFFELYNESQTVLPSLADPNRPSLWRQTRIADDIAEALRREPGRVRADVDDREFPANFGEWHGIDTPGGMGAGVTANIFGARQYTERTNDLLAITHAVARAPARPGQQEVFQGASRLRVLRNPSAFPRVWVVHEVASAANSVEARKMLGDASIDLRRRAPVGVPVEPLERCEGDEARIERYESDRVVMRASMRCKGLVVLADTWFPGWRAAVDGRSAEVLEAYGALRGVVAGGGEHLIELRYRPASAAVGAAMTASALLGCLLLGAASIRGRAARR